MYEVAAQVVRQLIPK